MENEIPTLESCNFKFTQDGHCCSLEEVESLIIECHSSLGIDRDNGCFFVLKTEQWAISNEIDLKNLFDRILKVINNEKD